MLPSLRTPSLTTPRSDFRSLRFTGHENVYSAGLARNDGTFWVLLALDYQETSPALLAE
jgi:hypothetical protein